MGAMTILTPTSKEGTAENDVANTLRAAGGEGDDTSPRTKAAKQGVVSTVEQHEINASDYGAQYAPTEKIRTVIVPSFPDLGRLSAWRFVEWWVHHKFIFVCLQFRCFLLPEN